MREISITFVLLCLGANLLFFLLRRWEAKEKPSPNYIPDYGLKAELKEQVHPLLRRELRTPRLEETHLYQLRRRKQEVQDAIPAVAFRVGVAAVRRRENGGARQDIRPRP